MDLSIENQLIRIVMAIVIGSIIGLERMKLHKVAGVRTHAVITVICTMLTMVSAYGFRGFPGTTDPSRLISNLLTGVGFLAGGVIYVTTRRNNRHEEENVVGLTTAAGIFGAAMLGIPIGLGYYPLAIITVLGLQFSLRTEAILKKLHIIKEEECKPSEEGKTNKENKKTE